MSEAKAQVQFSVSNRTVNFSRHRSQKKFCFDVNDYDMSFTTIVIGINCIHSNFESLISTT